MGKISGATRDGICGAYFQHWNTEPDALATTKDSGLIESAPEPICKDGQTLDEIASSFDPHTLGLSVRFAHGALNLAQVTASPELTQLFSKAVASKATDF